MRLLIKNGFLVLGSAMVRKNILIENDRILEWTDGEPAAERVIDAENGFVTPGFIDIHLHGGGGHDFMEATPEAFRAATEFHLMHGTTAMCPTSISAPVADIRAFLMANRAAMADSRVRVRLLGAHLEGPHLSEAKKGAHESETLRDPDLPEYELLFQEFPLIRRITAAPELPGVCDLARRFVPEGIQFSMGHSMARGEQIDEAMKAGFTSVTHLFNAMSSYGDLHGKKAAGLAEKALLEPSLYTELIGDLQHVPADLFRLAYRNKTAEKLILVTDALSAAGAPNGPVRIGSGPHSVAVDVREAAYLQGTNTLAGSVVSTDTLLKNALRIGIPFIDAIRMLTETPAKLLGCHHFIGGLNPGMGADVVVLNGQYEVTHVICRGIVIK